VAGSGSVNGGAGVPRASIVDSVARPARVGPQRLRLGIIACRQLSLRSAAGRRDEFFGFADSDVSYGSDHMFISIIPMGVLGQ
jgi:hypothetical protein